MHGGVVTVFSFTPCENIMAHNYENPKGNGATSSNACMVRIFQCEYQNYIRTLSSCRVRQENVLANSVEIIMAK